MVDEGEPRPRRGATYRPALGVGVLGTCVGLAWAGRPSIWYDEAATLSAIRRPPGEILRLVADRDAVHAAYYLTAWAWSQAVGNGIVALRAMSAIGLGVTAALVCLLVDHLVSRRAAVLSGAAAALLPGLAWTGLEGRSYAWSAALAVLATYLLVLSRESGGPVRWSTYSVVVALMIWWSFFSALMLLVYCLALVVAERRLRVTWLLASGAAAAACLPLAVLVRSQSTQVGWIHQTPSKVLAHVALRQVVIGQGHNSPGHPPYEIAAIGLGVVLVVLVGAWLRASDRAQDPFAFPLVLVWAIVPTVIVAGANLLDVQIYQARYLTFSTPAVAIVAGAGLATLQVPSRLSLGVVGLLLVVPILVSHRAEDDKAGDDYLALARMSRDAHTDLVVFARVDLRGIEIAYPAMFKGIRDVSLAEPPRRSHSLWGRNVRTRMLSRKTVAGRTLALYELTDPARRRVASRLHRLGCRRTGPSVQTPRSDGVVMRC